MYAKKNQNIVSKLSNSHDKNDYNNNAVQKILNIIILGYFCKKSFTISEIKISQL